MGDWLIGPIIDWLSGFVEDAINTLWALLAATILTTPDVTALPQVQAITARAVVIVNTIYVLVIIAAGIAVMAQGSLQVRYGLGELAPRLVIGFVAANFSTPICREAITVANALTRALTGDTITATGSFTQLLRIVTGALHDDVQALLTVIIVLVIAVLVAALLILWIMRLVTLILLAGIGPLALACHGLPWTQGAATLWWRALLACLATVVAQALALHTGLSILLDPGANLPALGLPHEPTATFNLFIVMCLLWMTVRIPGLVRRYVTGGARQRSVVGSILRFVIVQQLTRGLATRVRGLAAGARRPPTAPRGPAGPMGPGGRPGPGGRGGGPGGGGRRFPAGPGTGPGGPGRGRLGPAGPGVGVVGSGPGGRGPSAPGRAGSRPALSPQGTGTEQPGGSGARWRSGLGWPESPMSRAPRVPGAIPSGTGWPAPTPSLSRTGAARGAASMAPAASARAGAVARPGVPVGAVARTRAPVASAVSPAPRPTGAARSPRSASPSGSGTPSRPVAARSPRQVSPARPATPTRTGAAPTSIPGAGPNPHRAPAVPRRAPVAPRSPRLRAIAPRVIPLRGTVTGRGPRHGR